MGIEERFHGFVEIKLVFLIMEAMPFVILQHVLHIHATFTQRGHDLIAFGLLHTWVVGALCYKQRRNNAIRKKQR